MSTDKIQIMTTDELIAFFAELAKDGPIEIVTPQFERVNGIQPVVPDGGAAWFDALKELPHETLKQIDMVPCEPGHYLQPLPPHPGTVLALQEESDDLRTRLAAAESERTAFRSVLEGIEFNDIDGVGKMSAQDARFLGHVAKQQIYKIKARLEEAVKLVRTVEWDDPLDDMARCNVCGGKKPNHEPGCELDAFLAKLEDEK